MELLQVRGLWALRCRESAEKLQSALSSILTGVVDVLPIIPEAGLDSLLADGDGAGPGSAAAWSRVSKQCKTLRYWLGKTDHGGQK